MSVVVSVMFPILAGVLLFILPEKKMNRKKIHIYSGLMLAVEVLLLFFAIQEKQEISLFQFTDRLSFLFKPDLVSVGFAILVLLVWVPTAVFSFEYMEHERREKQFTGFFMVVSGILFGMGFAGNLVTFYLFYELMTLSSFPLVMHNRSKEAIMAGLKYLFYSLCGAYLVLFGLFYLSKNASTMDFTSGGGIVSGGGNMVLLVCLCMILGFSVKGGMFPLHAWLPTAHPVAPAPASAFLSAVIVKAGVLGVIRTVFYLFGPDVIRGTFVQYTWMTLSLITVFMGSMLAYREPVFKKRLAYSTVSQVSYILFGLSLLNEGGMVGGLQHALFHALMKAGLFLFAGAVIFKTGKTRVDELAGIGKEMPIALSCYTIFSLSLVGIPPLPGFVSKWNLAVSAIATELPVVRFLGPVILLVSALLTAGYLLPPVMQGFFPGEHAGKVKIEKKEPGLCMLIALVFLAMAVVALGLFPGYITAFGNTVAEALM